MDYRTRVVGLEDYVALSGDAEKDLERLLTFYADKAGKFPDQASDIRFRS